MSFSPTTSNQINLERATAQAKGQMKQHVLVDERKVQDIATEVAAGARKTH